MRGEVLSSEEVVGGVGDGEKVVWSLAIVGVLYRSSRGEGGQGRCAMKIVCRDIRSLVGSSSNKSAGALGLCRC